MNWLLFFHLAGIIIGLGAVTVIDTMGFISRKSKPWTQTTIEAHHVTKPLIWIGTILVSISWIFILMSNYLEGIYLIKTLILGVLILNGIFLSFYISPRLDKLYGKKVLIPKKLQNEIMLSFILSFSGWWTFVYLTVSNLS